MFIKCNDHLIHLTISGPSDAPVLVLLHSLGTSSALWDYQVADLSQNFRVICPDFRGHGLSAPSKDHLTCELLADDVLDALNALGITAFSLAGVSMGGVVAQIIAARAKTRVKGLAIFDSYIQSLAPQMWRTRAQTIRADGLAAIAPGVLKVWIPEDQAKDPMGQGLWLILKQASDEGYAAGCDALEKADCTHIAAHISCPTIVAYGSEDMAAPASAAQVLADAIPGAKLEVIPGAGHLPMFHFADACIRIIRAIA